MRRPHCAGWLAARSALFVLVVVLCVARAVADLFSGSGSGVSGSGDNSGTGGLCAFSMRIITKFSVYFSWGVGSAECSKDQRDYYKYRL